MVWMVNFILGLQDFSIPSYIFSDDWFILTISAGIDEMQQNVSLSVYIFKDRLISLFYPHLMPLFVIDTFNIDINQISTGKKYLECLQVYPF